VDGKWYLIRGKGKKTEKERKGKTRKRRTRNKRREERWTIHSPATDEFV